MRFLEAAGLGDNPVLLGYNQDTRNWVMVCYTVYLATGSTLLAISIKVDTIR